MTFVVGLIQLCRAAVPLALLALLSPASIALAEEKPKDKFEKELDEIIREKEALDEKIDVLLRKALPRFDLDTEKQRAIAIAKAAEAGEVEVKAAGSERLLLADRRPSYLELHRMEVSGRAPYESVHSFLLRMARFYVTRDLEVLRIQPEPDNTVSFTARYAVIIFSPQEWEPRAQRTMLDPNAPFREILVNRKLNHQLLLQLEERFKPDRFISALAAFYEDSLFRAVALTGARLTGGEAVLEGVVLGASARDGLKPALEKAGFRVGRLQMAPDGACQKFSATVQLEPREHPFRAVIYNGLFDAGAAAFCKVEKPGGARVTVRGKPGTPAGSALTLRLRGVRLVDAFGILHELTSQSFLVDPDVEGRTDLDVEGATLEETLAAMRSAGVVIGPGPLYRVSRAGTKQSAFRPPAGGYKGDPVNISVTNAGLGNTLCALAGILERELEGPRGLQDRSVTLLASDLPADQAMDVLIASAGFTSKLDGNRLLIGPQAGAVGMCKGQPDGSPSTGPSRLAGLTMSAPHLAPADLVLAGIARKGDGEWRAWAYSPAKDFVSLEPGLEISGAKVQTVGPAGVSFATDASKVVTIPFQP